MLGELVTTMTPDQVRLHGYYVPPIIPRSSGEFASIEESSGDDRDSLAVILLHGLAGNFYGSPLLVQLARRFHQAGYAVVLGNTRGHDYLNATVRVGRTRTLGAAVELVSEGVEDVAGWVRFLQSRGHSRVILVGHSLGAIKVILSQAQMATPGVSALVALSPTRLNFQQFAACRQRDKFLETIARAEQAVTDGRGDELLSIEFPFPTWMSASAYLNKYGADNRYDWLPLIDRIAQPSLITFGQLELDDNPALEGLVDQLQQLVDSGKAAWRHESSAQVVERAARAIEPSPSMKESAAVLPPQITLLSRADHFYVAAYDRVADLILPWLEMRLKQGGEGKAKD